MNAKINLLTSALCGALLAGCSAKSEKTETNPAAEKKSEAEPRVKHGTNDEVLITVNAATQKVMGLQTSPLAPAQLKPELKAYGRVLDSTPLASQVVELATASAATEASQAELKRLQTLAAQHNASDRAVQAAQATATHDQTQFEAARLRLLANWGSAIAQRKDLAAFAESLVSLATVLVQLDLPAGHSLEAPPLGARLLTLADDSKPISADLVGPVPVVDAQLQARGFFFLVESNAGRLAPGASVTGFMIMPGEAQPGVMMPRNAVVRFNGAAWVYRQTGEDTFERVEVPLEHPLPGGWFVSEGFKPEDKIVTNGAQQLLSEELKGQGGEQ